MVCAKPVLEQETSQREKPTPRVVGRFSLSCEQESLWFMDQMVPGNALYNIPEAWRLKGCLSREALQASLNELVRRHETLRTVFASEIGTPKQIVQTPLAFELAFTDLRGGSSPEEEAQHQLAKETVRPFDLRTAPLARAHLLQLANDEHILFVNMHHIISDMWSYNVFLNELSQAYAAHLAGKTPSWEPLPIQFADYAVWQRQNLNDEKLAGQKEYWKNQLRSPLPELELPNERPRPACKFYKGETQFFIISPEIASALRELSRAHGSTLFMTTLAAFKVLLHRYTGQEDIVVGSPNAGREPLETEGLIGLFVKTQPLRTDLSGDPTFLELLARVRTVTLDGFANAAVPIETVMRELQTERDAQPQPLFQVVFGLQTAVREDWSLAGTKSAHIDLDNGGAKFDWTVLLTETREGLQVRWEYDSQLFNAATITRAERHLETSLQSIITDPQKRISELSLVSEPEQRVLTTWNETNTRYEREKCIHELFDQQASSYPEAIALVFEGQKITYGELRRRADSLAKRLKAMGIGPDVPVGVCIERSPEMVVAMLGALKAGGGYVPLDPSYPAERLNYLVQDAQLRVLLADKRSAPGFAQAGIEVINVDTIVEGASDDNLPNRNLAPTQTRAEHLAYIIYTSGSTGAPKGVVVPHRGVVRLVRNTNYVTFSRQDVFLQFASPSFDASTFEIWGALLNGASLVIAPPAPQSLAELGRLIESHGVTTLWLTAGLFHQMVDQQVSRLRNVRQLLAGGEALSAAHVAKAARELPGCRLVNGYGPTENTTFTCCFSVPSEWSENGSVPIGRPISNTQVYILDERMKPVPLGVSGELFAAGDGLARGYLNRPELTREKFVDWNGKRLYRTGDRARWRSDATIEFLGRLDEQLKIRGFRVEPGEVEAALSLHPDVAQAAVVARLDHSGTKHLAACVVPKRPCTTLGNELQEFLGRKLPSYLVPNEFLELEQLPLTSNGKVDRKSLAALTLKQPTKESSSVVPRNDTENLLAKIWSEVLEREGIGIHESFFRLGGHSLIATQVISRIAEVMKLELPIRAIFEAPTIAGLAETIARAKHTPTFRPPPLRRRSSLAKTNSTEPPSITQVETTAISK